MERTIGTEEREKLVISFSIEKGKGIALSKEIANMFREQKKRYKFFMTKQSYFYKFDNLRIQVYADKYLESKFEIIVYKVGKDYDKVERPIINDVLEKAAKHYIKGEKNNMFLLSSSTFEIANTEGVMTKLNEKSKSEFCYLKEGNIYSISMSMKYNVKTDRNDGLFEDNICIRMPIQKEYLFLIPHVVPKIFKEKERVRTGVKNNIEEII